MRRADELKLLGAAQAAAPPASPASESAWKPWLVGGAAALSMLGLSCLLMWQMGLLNIPKDETGSKTLAAALALLGTLVTAAVTLIGTVIKYSIDERAASDARLQKERDYAVSLDSAQRNRIEAAIRAVDLLSENNKDATTHQIGGAVLALVSLGELDLAVALLNQLWPPRLVSDSVAYVTLQRALKDGDHSTKIGAAATLMQQADRIGQGDYHIWPLENLGWDKTLSGNCRLGLVQAAVRWMICDLERSIDQLPSASVVLYQALDDGSANVVDIAAASLRPLLDCYPPDCWTDSGDVKMLMSDLALRLAAHPTEAVSFAGAKLGAEVQAVFDKVKAAAAAAP